MNDAVTDGTNWFELGHNLGMALPIGLGTLLGSALTVVLSFFILSFPLRLLIVYSNNYKLAMRCRVAADWLLVAIIIVVLFQGLTASITTFIYLTPDSDVFWTTISQTLASLMTVVPFYLILQRMVNRTEFYSEKHVDYLEYFILYLRSFKDDSRRGKLAKKEQQLMKSLRRLFFPFAIGKPNEFMPPRGAKRIYVGENWQDIVVGLQKKAPLILQRVSTSESYLWEFDQCVQGGHLKKVIFWVSDYDDYEQFRGYVAMKYQLLFPDLSSHKGTDLLFYYLPGGEIRTYQLDDKKAYHRFAEIYVKEHPEHTRLYQHYLYGRRNIDLLRLAFSPTYDQRVMPGINQWSWVGFFFPEFFMICHTIKYRILFYLLFTLVLGVLMSAAPGIFTLINLTVFLVMAKNGRTLAWQSYKWESVDYFNKRFKFGDKLALTLGILRIMLWFVVGFWLMFNPFGWDIPHYDWAAW